MFARSSLHTQCSPRSSRVELRREHLKYGLLGRLGLQCGAPATPLENPLAWTFYSAPTCLLLGGRVLPNLIILESCLNTNPREARCPGAAQDTRLGRTTTIEGNYTHHLSHSSFPLLCCLETYVLIHRIESLSCPRQSSPSVATAQCEPTPPLLSACHSEAWPTT